MLKKISLILVCIIVQFAAKAQETPNADKPSKFGFTAGFMDSNVNNNQFILNEDTYNLRRYAGGGMFLGLTFDTNFNKDFGLNSELIWAKLNNSSRYMLSTSLKYRLFNSNFNALGGLELNYLSSTPHNSAGEEFGNRAGLNALVGLEYEINDRMSIHANYSYELTNRYKEPVRDEKSTGINNLRLGLKFKF